MPDFVPCRNPACMRKVSPASRHCCGPCSLAHEDGWDIDGGHSVPCNERAWERGEYDRDEANALRGLP